MKKRFFFALLTAALVSLLFLGNAAYAQPASTQRADCFPTTIPLPDFWGPEGIGMGLGTTAYLGSRLNGAIMKVDLATGEQSIVVQPHTGGWVNGIHFDPRSNYLYTASGERGKGEVWNAATGEKVAEFQFGTPPSTFINDEVITRDAVYWTESWGPYLYKVPLQRNGQLTNPPTFERITLTGDWEMVTGYYKMNANGIVATPNGKQLIVVNESVGKLYLVDPKTGYAKAIDLGDQNVLGGDGLLLQGRTIYVVQNRQNKIAEIQLSPNLQSGHVERYITDPRFNVPTTIVKFAGALYTMNSQLGPPVQKYEIERVPLH